MEEEVWVEAAEAMEEGEDVDLGLTSAPWAAAAAALADAELDEAEMAGGRVEEGEVTPGGVQTFVLTLTLLAVVAACKSLGRLLLAALELALALPAATLLALVYAGSKRRLWPYVSCVLLLLVVAEEVLEEESMAWKDPGDVRFGKLRRPDELVVGDPLADVCRDESALDVHVLCVAMLGRV